MGAYIKNPVIIEAALFDGRLVGEPDGLGTVMAGTCPSWFPAVVEEIHVSNGHVVPAGQVFKSTHGLHIGTLEGAHLASPGDWIIKGIKGEKYPCKPDIFEATYSPMMQAVPASPVTEMRH